MTWEDAYICGFYLLVIFGTILVLLCLEWLFHKDG